MASPKPNKKPETEVVFSNTSSNTYKYQDTWRATMLDSLWLFTLQLLSAGGSGAIAKTAVAPLERAKILLQVQHMAGAPQAQQYKGLVDILQRLPKEQGGYKALFRGNGANVARLVPEVAFKFVMHDQFKVMFTPPEGKPFGMSEKLAAGAATGVLKTYLFYPLDLCRARITADTSPPDARRYGSLRQTAAKTWRQEGVRGLYRGVTISAVGVVPYLTISMCAYDELKQRLPKDKATKEKWWFPWLKMGCGAAAGISAQLLTYPLDTLRRRMQVNCSEGHPLRYRGYFDCLKQTLRQEGPRALYRGCLINCVKTVPGAGLQFVAYDLIKTTIQVLDPTTGASSPL